MSGGQCVIQSCLLTDDDFQLSVSELCVEDAPIITATPGFLSPYGKDLQKNISKHQLLHLQRRFLNQCITTPLEPNYPFTRVT